MLVLLGSVLMLGAVPLLWYSRRKQGPILGYIATLVYFGGACLTLNYGTMLVAFVFACVWIYAVHKQHA